MDVLLVQLINRRFEGLRMIFRLLLMWGISAVFCLPCQAASTDIYQYTDNDGVVHFSNVNVASGKKFRKVKSVSPRVEAARAETDARVEEPSVYSPKKAFPSTYSDLIKTSCDRHGVDPRLVHAIVKVESDFNPFAVSKKGARGLMQLMPQTAFDWNVSNSYSPDENIEGGVRYLRYLLDRYEGNLTLALAAYNSGETAVQKWGTIPPFPETQNYVQKILRLYNGTGGSLTPRYTIYVGYGDDGALVLTDDPSKGKKMFRKTSKNL